MAQLLTIARPYAKALFAMATEQETVSIWIKILKVLSEVVNDSHLIQKMKDPRVGSEELHSILLAIGEDLFKKNSDFMNVSIKPLLNLLITHKRLAALPAIYYLFYQLSMKAKKVLEVEVFSAFTLTGDQRHQLKAALENKFNATLAIHYQEDESLIGGLLVKTEHWVMDDSIKTKLIRLKQSLAA